MVFLPGPSEPVYLYLINFCSDALCAESVLWFELPCLPLQMKSIPSGRVFIVLLYDLSPLEAQVREIYMLLSE